MPSEPENRRQTPVESEEKQLYVSCMYPNEPLAHFCANCGAPLSPYAATGPIESVFAEGHVFRQAAEKPRKLVVVLGIWFIFGLVALAGAVLPFIGREADIESVVVGALLLVISLAMIWKSTRSYLARPRVAVKRDA